MADKIPYDEFIDDRWCDPSVDNHEDHYWTDEEGVEFYCAGRVRG